MDPATTAAATSSLVGYLVTAIGALGACVVTLAGALVYLWRHSEQKRAEELKMLRDEHVTERKVTSAEIVATLAAQREAHRIETDAARAELAKAHAENMLVQEHRLADLKEANVTIAEQTARAGEIVAALEDAQERTHPGTRGRR